MHGTSVLNDEPMHKVQEFVHEIATRRENTLYEMKEEVAGFVTAMINQLMLLKKWHPHWDMRKVTFDRPVWRQQDGVIVFTMLYDGRPIKPQDIKLD